MISRSDVSGALARGYQSERNHCKEIDIELIDAMTDEIMAVISTELQREEFYQAIRADKEGRRR